MSGTGFADDCQDNDNDGFDAESCGGTDCDDDDDKIYPGAEEICDGKDSDCDDGPYPDEIDLDYDGFMICAGDCDDDDNNVYPNAIEICDNGIDDDCDKATDCDDEDCASDSLCSEEIPEFASTIIPSIITIFSIMLLKSKHRF